MGWLIKQVKVQSTYDDYVITFEHSGGGGVGTINWLVCPCSWCWGHPLVAHLYIYSIFNWLCPE